MQAGKEEISSGQPAGAVNSAAGATPPLWAWARSGNVCA